MSLVLLLALPYVAALLLWAMPERARLAAEAVALLATLIAGICLAGLAPDVFAGEVPAVFVPWLPFPGAGLGLRLDGLAWMFSALVVGIGALVILYTRYYLPHGDQAPHFFAGFMFFMGSMLGIVLADNLLLLVVFWELTSLASCLLIAYWRHRPEARRGARMALIVTGGGGLALLAGVLLIGSEVGSFRLDDVLVAGPAVRASTWYPLILVLVLLGAFTKSAQFPFHFWLPDAMAAPTPVSAYLHSATLVKAGVFLLARLYPVLGGSDPWFWLVGGTGLITLVTGAYMAVFQHDLKGLLAYSTISHLGLITLLFGLDHPTATVAGVFHILNHATFKASLFMAAGIIDHETGCRDMRRLNGLWRYMPVTGALAITSSLAMAGVPLFNGFLSKEMFFAETLVVGRHTLVQAAVPVIATLAGALTVAYSARFVHDVFWNGEPRDPPRTPHEPPAWMLVPVAVLAVLCVLVGIWPRLIVGPLLAVGASATLSGELPAYTLTVWHGFSLPLAMSLVALLLGVLFYVYLQRIFRLHDRVHLPYGAREIYAALMGAVTGAAHRMTGGLEAGGVRRTLVWMALVALLAGAAPLMGRLSPVGEGATAIPPLALVVWLLGIAGTAAVVALHRQRLIALLMLGAVGLMVSLTFAGLSAPDLALTQLLVEVASILLLLMALRYLPQSSPAAESPIRRGRDALIAGLCGLGVTTLVWHVMTRPFDTIGEWHLANALPGAAGANAVNVIIVDFRGLDTFGEITVLAVAALLVAAVLRGFAPRRPARAPTGPARSFLLERAAPVLLPLALMVGLFAFFRGHNLPGGGFIGGLICALGLLLPTLARGTAWVEARRPVDHYRTLGAGLLVAGATGIGSLLFGYPFLTSSHVEPALPLIGAVPVVSAMFFDLGVLLVVSGATLLTLSVLGHLNPGATTGARG